MANIGLPAISSKLPPDVRQFLSRVREVITDGDFLTRAELTEAGIVSLDAFGNMAPGGGGQPGSDDRSIPPAPVGVRANGAMTNIILEWDDPLYGNFSYAEIFRSGTSLFTDAVHVGVATGTMYADAVAQNSNYWYWVRFWSKANVVGPWHGTVGVNGKTAKDPAYLMDLITGNDPLVPFVTLAVETVINGVVCPPGVYMKSAFFANGIIGNAQIGTAAIDDAKVANLSAAKVTFGEMSGDRIKVNTLSADRLIANTLAAKLATITEAYIVNANISGAIQSGDYNAGVAGWKIDKGGACEFHNIVARGDIQATSLNAATGTFKGALSAATGTFAGNLSAAGGTFSGNLSAAGGTFSGNLNAAGGSFKGDISAATGHFTGQVDIGTAQVGTLMLAGNAVTIPISGGRSTQNSMSAIYTSSFTLTETSPVALIFEIDCRAEYQAPSDPATTTGFVNIRRNGVGLKAYPTSRMSPVDDRDGMMAMGLERAGCILETLPPGTYSYSMDSAGYFLFAGSLLVIVCKR